MFMTQDHAEEPLGQPFSRDHFWKWVELFTDDVWYYVIATYQKDTGKGFRYYLLTKPVDLVNFIDETDEEFWIERVMAVIPPHINETGRWEMHQLKELIAMSYDADVIKVDYVHRLKGDLVFGLPELRDDGIVIRNQVLFSEERHASLEDKTSRSA
jgi:hypothetical protein